MGFDAKNAAEPVSIDPGKLLRLAVEHELATPHEGDSGVAGNRNDGAFRKRLEATLKAWQGSEDEGFAGLPFVSFATAFQIEGKKIVEVINGITPNESPWYSAFTVLTACPLRSEYGAWPWAMMRGSRQSTSGAFAPQLLLIGDAGGSVPAVGQPGEWRPYPQPLAFTWPESIPASEVEAEETIAALSSGTASQSESWCVYAVLPSLIADQHRPERNGKKKKTHALVYLLGTRSEFVTHGPAKDWGLIVGLTGKARESGMDMLKRIMDAIVASWNLLAVAPFAIAQAGNIAQLRAQQLATHFFKTQVQILLDELQNPRSGDPKATDQAINYAKGLHSLIGLNLFLFRGGLAMGWAALRGEDIEQYNLVNKISSYLKTDNHLQKYSVTISVPDGSEYLDLWVRFAYFRAILDDLISNAKKHGRGGKYNCDISVSGNGDSDDKLCITLSNELDEEEALRTLRRRNLLVESKQDDTEIMAAIAAQEDRQLPVEDMVRGEAAARAFFNCLGGEYKGIVTCESIHGRLTFYYEASMSYNLGAWKRLVDEWKQLNDCSDSAQEPESGTSLPPPTISECPPPEDDKVCFRILLLDDNFAHPQRALPALKTSIKHAIWADFQLYRRTLPQEKGAEFFCFGLFDKSRYQPEFVGLEVVLCMDLDLAKRSLTGVHFDILLVDVDFKRTYEAAPLLGGFLFALVPREHAVVRVMTALDAEMKRDSRDYVFLMDLQEIPNATDRHGGSIMKHLSVAKISPSSKSISVQLRVAFLEWLVYVFSKDADPSSRFAWARWLRAAEEKSVRDATVAGKKVPGKILRALDPLMSESELANIERHEHERIKKLATSLKVDLFDPAAAVCQVFDATEEHHSRKAKLFKYYASDRKGPIPEGVSEELWGSWKQEVDALLESAPDKGKGFVEALRAVIAQFGSDKEGLRAKLNNLFRGKATLARQTTDIYGLLPNTQQWEKDAIIILGKDVCAEPICKELESWGEGFGYSGLLIAGNKNYDCKKGGQDTKAQLRHLKAYMSIVEPVCIGHDIESLKGIPDEELRNHIVACGIWRKKEYKDKLGLVAVMRGKLPTLPTDEAKGETNNG